MFVNSLEGLLFSAPLLLSPINARAAAKASSVSACPGPACCGSVRATAGRTTGSGEQISEGRNDGRSD